MLRRLIGSLAYLPSPTPLPTRLMKNTLPENERTRCEIWTRVMGYHRPVSQFNAGKKSEHRERTPFREEQPPMQRAA